MSGILSSLTYYPLLALEFLREKAYVVIEYCLNLTGGQIPEGDYPIFLTTLVIAGWMVAVDACIFEVAVLPFIKKRLWLPVIILITIVHAVAGYLGLGMLIAGIATGATLWVMLFVTSWGGLRFIVSGAAGDDDDNPNDMAKKLAAGLFTLTAFFLYWGVSYDEFFAVWQRFQWMVAQKWNEAAMAVNIGLSMIVLFAAQCLVILGLLVFKPFTNWIQNKADHMMFVVFSLLMYYMVRGIMQNGLGYDPYEIPYTGIAPDLLIAGFVLMAFFMRALKNSKFLGIVQKALLIKDETEADDAANDVEEVNSIETKKT